MKKAVLVTASSKGLGREIARQFLEQGNNVIINGRNKSELDGALTEYENVYRFHQDMSQGASADNLGAFVSSEGLFIECAVHNLGGRLDNDRHPLDLKVLEATMRLNLLTAVEINNLVIPEMIKKGSGKIFHIGSSAGYTGNAAPCYAISKGALNTYVKNTARFYAKENISICAVIPGILDHEGSDWDRKRINEPDKYNARISQMPMGRFQKPEDIAPVIVSLYKSDTMAITGSIIETTGGM